jgi:NDP-sugar pyrophosphorylase family protein
MMLIFKVREKLAKRYRDFHIIYSGIYLYNPKVCRSGLHDRPHFQTRDQLTRYDGSLLSKYMKQLLAKVTSKNAKVHRYRAAGTIQLWAAPRSGDRNG